MPLFFPVLPAFCAMQRNAFFLVRRPYEEKFHLKNSIFQRRISEKENYQRDGVIPLKVVKSGICHWGVWVKSDCAAIIALLILKN
ncbi:hypothetical protein [Ciceribacter sp. RN22]|uniref:hypothetical protein n=1 Tax=Ciceribacter sp. RN22 TaxID=2954932 RepID=UPI00209225C1|nr:hypothetical protein [Ciceribacter sp. RN22]MCO6179614.1 hypothetical protein [Ciceribacter sp. RN22]